MRDRTLPVLARERDFGQVHPHDPPGDRHRRAQVGPFELTGQAVTDLGADGIGVRMRKPSSEASSTS